MRLPFAARCILVADVLVFVDSCDARATGPGFIAKTMEWILFALALESQQCFREMISPPELSAPVLGESLLAVSWLPWRWSLFPWSPGLFVVSVWFPGGLLVVLWFSGGGPKKQPINNRASKIRTAMPCYTL